ncbi:spondin domain-containing protein [Gramella lutea]|uniref:Spondin domain-containing protein n=1 Tax=Christiangramia lutea TaxID=1607951 RepID=A0A9X1V5U0_9FLAO|nr:spondin domain-containing protein [Christiangramia lutea]MCH4824226.1 spondin domain-containing protein [Christiangramia lutea]
MRRVFLFTFTLAAVLLSCTTDNAELNEELTTAELKSQTGKENDAFTKFKVTIENVTEEGTFTTPFSPGVYLVQKKNSEPLFSPWEADYGEGLEAIAEDGSANDLNESLMNNPKVRSHGVFMTPVGASGGAPIFPGDAYEFYIEAKPNDYLNFATMFIQSNDLFIAPDAQGVPLFDGKEPKSGDITMYLSLWDAGTEVNEEPGVGPNQAPRQSGPDTGIVENGVVRLVDDGYTYPEIEEVIKVTISPMY